MTFKLTFYRDRVKQFKDEKLSVMDKKFHAVIGVWRVWRFGAVGSDVGRINEVTLRRARLVLGWVTVSGFNSRCGKFISV